MRKLLSAVLTSLLLTGCSGGKKAPVFDGTLSDVFLEGTWMVSGSDFSALKNAPFFLKDSLDTYMLMHLYHFGRKGELVSDNADITPLAGKYEADDKTLKLKIGDAVQYYSLERGSDSSMILRVEKNNDPLFEDAQISLKRINTKLYKLNETGWKKAPSAPLSNGDVRGRLLEMLTYYEQFFRAMTDRNISIMAHRKILMPVKYFSNGIALRAFEERKGWDVFFGDSTHARTAYNMLQKAFDKINLFPSRKDLFVLYADIFAMMAKNLNAEK